MDGDESKAILKKYLVKELPQLISESQFYTMLRKVARGRGISRTESDELLLLLTELRDQYANGEVRRNVDAAQFVSIYDDNDNGSQNASNDIGEREVSKLIASLQCLDRSIQDEIARLDAESAKELAAIQKVVEGVPSTATTAPSDAFEKSEKTLDRLARKLV